MLTVIPGVISSNYPVFTSVLQLSSLNQGLEALFFCKKKLMLQKARTSDLPVVTCCNGRVMQAWHQFTDYPGFTQTRNFKDTSVAGELGKSNVRYVYDNTYLCVCLFLGDFVHKLALLTFKCCTHP